MRKIIVKSIDDVHAFKTRAVHWASQFEHAVCLDSNGHRQKYSSFDFLVAADALDPVVCQSGNAFSTLENTFNTRRDWLFGYLGYDLKNELEDLNSGNADVLQFPDMMFFRPRKLMILRGNMLEMHYLTTDATRAESDLNDLLNTTIPAFSSPGIDLAPHVPKADYLDKIGQMKAHIARGDIYEANFCMEFSASGTIHPASAFAHLNEISKAPFSAFLQMGDYHILSASPERYLCKQGGKLISQPIKGTAARSQDRIEDIRAARELQTNQKERSENIMIVDLVRNDLARTAARGTVKVEELCGVYSFAQVHQLISTISSRLGDDFTAFDAIQASFPMGSMTGAPKISAMKIIEKLEESRRGAYSGAIGYFTPEGDFDFNVVIRSILYNKPLERVAFQVGSAITHLSDSEAEYAECLLKARAMRQVLDR